MVGSFTYAQEESLIDLRWSHDKAVAATLAYQITITPPQGGGQGEGVIAIPVYTFEEIAKAVNAALTLVHNDFNQDGGQIDEWKIEGDILTIKGTIGKSLQQIAVRVSMQTYDATYADETSEKMAKAALAVRQDVANRVRSIIVDGDRSAEALLDIEGVHINKCERLLYMHRNSLDNDVLIYPNPLEGYGLTARIDGYEDYVVKLRHEIFNPYYYWHGYFFFNNRITTLTSFLNKKTGVDMVLEATSLVLEVMNPESDMISVDSWNLINGNLDLTIDFHSTGNPFIKYLGSQVNVMANLATGSVSITNSALLEAVLRSRNEVVHKLGVDYGDTHVNWVLADPDFRFNVTPIENSYAINVTTSAYDMIFHFDASTGSLKLLSFQGRDSENKTNLVQAALDKLNEVYETSKTVDNTDHIELVRIDSNGNVFIEFQSSEHKGTIATVGVNLNTGKVAEINVRQKGDFFGLAVYSERTIKYNEDGSLVRDQTHVKFSKEITLIGENGQAGKININVFETDSAVNYGADGKAVSSFCIKSRYDSNGRLESSDGKVIIGDTEYNVKYSIENGVIVGTSVTDKEGNSVFEVGAYASADKIIYVLSVIVNPASHIYRDLFIDAEGNVVISDPIKLDKPELNEDDLLPADKKAMIIKMGEKKKLDGIDVSDLLQRKGVEERLIVLQQGGANYTVTSQMAVKKQENINK